MLFYKKFQKGGISVKDIYADCKGSADIVLTTAYEIIKGIYIVALYVLIAYGIRKFLTYDDALLLIVSIGAAVTFARLSR